MATPRSIARGNTTFNSKGHVKSTDAIPQHVYVRVTWQDAIMAGGEIYCSESSSGSEADNTVLFTVVVMGRPK
jgi:hypothetical protein